jgi:hypothetical protein
MLLKCPYFQKCIQLNLWHYSWLNNISA